MPVTTRSSNRKRHRELPAEFIIDLSNEINQQRWNAVQARLDSIEDGQFLPNGRSSTTNQTILHIAANRNIPTPLLERLVQVVDQDYCVRQDDEGNTPLFIAVSMSSAECIENIVTLATLRPDLLVLRNNKGNAPIEVLLTRSFQGNNASLLLQQVLQRLLILLPVAIHYRTTHGSNLLHLASGSCCYFTSKSVEVARLLLDKKPSLLKETNDTGYTPVHVLATVSFTNTSVERMQLYVERGGIASLRKRDKNGSTPLHCATSSLSKRMVECIVEQDSSLVDMANGKGQTPLDVFQIHFSYQHACGTKKRLYLQTKMAQAALPLMFARPMSLSQAPSLHSLLSFKKESIGRQLHPLLKALFVHVFREQVPTRDEHGNWPLHIVANMTPHSCSHFVELVTVTLRWYPAAARLTNAEGMLPLAIVARAGHAWNSGIRIMLEAYPAAVEELDLWDVILLIENLAKEAQNSEDGECTDGLQGIYQILRTAPTILQS